MIIATFTDNTFFVTGKLWQYDYGQVLQIKGLDLPEDAEIHFSTKETGGDSIKKIGTRDDGVITVSIPDVLLSNGGTKYDYEIFAFAYVTDSTSGHTRYKIRMQVASRPKPADYLPDDDPTSTTRLEKLESIVSDMRKDVTKAQGAVTEIKTDVSAVKTDMSAVKADVTAVKADVTGTKTDVSTLKTEMSTLKIEVSTLTSDMTTAKGDITALKTKTTTLETDASTLKTDVSTLKTDTATLKTDTTTLKTDVATLKTDVATLKTTVDGLDAKYDAKYVTEKQMKDYVDEVLGGIENGRY